MGDIAGYWWFGAAMVGILLIALVWSWLKPANTRHEGCPWCRHDDGLDASKQHCGTVEYVGGWGSADHCPCDSDYHWNYESVE